jgi:exopolysaccharide production protein ExoQ
MTRVLSVAVFASFLVLLVNPSLGFSSYLGDPYAVRGALIDKNALGDLMGFVVLTSGYSFVSRANNRIFSGSVLAGSLILVAAAPATTSRLVVLATIALALYSWLIRNRSRSGWAIIAAIWTVVGVGLLTFVAVDFNDVLKLVGKSATLTGRTDIWRAVIQTIHERPLLGFGYAFWTAPSVARMNIWYEIGFAPPHAHNNWLDVILQLGYVGLAISVAFWLIALGRGFRFAMFTREPGAIFMLLIIVNLFIRSWTESVMLEPADMFWMWFVLAYLYLSRMSVVNRMRKKAAIPAYSAYRGDPVPSTVAIAQDSR